MRRVVLAVAVLAGLSGCTSRTAPSPVCVDGTATRLDGAQGTISAGPLGVNRDYWTQPQGTKFWVARSRQQEPTTAHLTAVPLSGGAPVIVVRGPDQLAGGTSSALFYPGSLRLPEPGLWRVTVRIGPDEACFDVEAAAQPE